MRDHIFVQLRGEFKMKKPSISKETASRVRKALKETLGKERAGLFPLHIDTVRKVSKLELNAGDEETYSMLLESICGTTDDSQPVEQYDGALGVTTAFVAAHQSPVGQLQWNNNLASIYNNPGNVSDVRWCSGTLITNDLFLTAGHCFDQSGGGWIRPVDNTTGVTISPAEIATNMHVNFNYQVDPSGTLRAEQSYPVLNLVEYRLGGLDFAIVQLGGNPGATWGTTQIATTDAAPNDMLCIIGHPAGWPKRIEAGPCLKVTGTSIRYDDIDTLGGNSGSGVLRASDGLVVGVHTNGGCGPHSPGIGYNFGVAISAIIAQSPTIQNLTAPTLKFIDDRPTATLKSLDDHVTLKFADDGVKVTLKSLDDHRTLKFFDDGGGTLKSLDDHVTLKYFDDGGTATFKSVDDAKTPAMDKGFSDHKIPGSDGMPWSGRPYSTGMAGPAPFVLSTPHHSMAWAGIGGGQAGFGIGSETVAAQYEQVLVQMEQTIRQHLDAISQLESNYRQLLAEYQALTQKAQP
jgi:V8-like Glu-specific endopeptidase